jgi:nicotinate phosphoribosyltransferase
VDAGTLQWLADFSFSGDIYGYAEGEAYFPGSPS